MPPSSPLHPLTTCRPTSLANFQLRFFSLHENILNITYRLLCAHLEQKERRHRGVRCAPARKQACVAMQHESIAATLSYQVQCFPDRAMQQCCRDAMMPTKVMSMHYRRYNIRDDVTYCSLVRLELRESDLGETSNSLSER